ncbi:MAG: serine/threonine-protein kinase, partial [Pseudomonadota bacterium]
MQGTAPGDRQFAPDSMVDHYRVIRAIGRGGMGEVYLARDTTLGRLVALKVISQGRFLLDESAVERFLEEARITAAFNHPHIVTVYGVGEHRGRPYLALEYVEGETLRQRMNAEKVAPKEVMRIGRAIAEALAEAHQNGVLHRDLKPENVILAKDGRLRVLDLGLATLLGESTGSSAPIVSGSSQTRPKTAITEHDEEAMATIGDPDHSSAGFLVGTPFYIAPEGWRGERIGEAADVWALGIVLHELLLEKRPYQDTPPGMLPAVVATLVPVPLVKGPGIPEELARLVDRCLAKEAKERPSAAEVGSQLEGLFRWRHLEGEMNPFRGLLAFNVRHSDLFFGRDAEVAAFLEALREQPVLGVVGPSGVGKSSFVQAGVIARLLESEPWTIVRLRPGSDPFEALASRIRQGGGEEANAPESSQQRWDTGLLTALQQVSSAGAAAAVPASGSVLRNELAARLAASSRFLNVLLHELASNTKRRVLLFVDQLEEIFTLVEEEETRRRFVEAVCKAAEETASPVRVVFTIRDDFLGRVMAGVDVGRALDRVVVLRTPGRAELAEMLGRPVVMSGYRYEDLALLDEMVASVVGEPACLPLLQFAAQLLWEKRDRGRRVILRSVYQEIGGIPGALAEHADAVLAG